MKRESSRLKRHIAILSSMPAAMSSSFFFARQLTARVSTLVQAHGYHYSVYDQASSQDGGQGVPGGEAFAESLASHRVMGVIAVSTPYSAAWIAPLQEQGIPVVGTECGYPSGVANDLLDLVDRGVELCASVHRRRVALMSWNCEHTGGHPVARRFLHCMEREELTCRPDWILTHLHAQWPEMAGHMLRTLWGAKERPDALLLTHDSLYAGLVNELQRLRIRLPEDLLIVKATASGDPQRTFLPLAEIEIDMQVLADRIVTAMIQTLHGLDPVAPAASAELLSCHMHPDVLQRCTPPRPSE